jgi:hypothetical protein
MESVSFAKESISIRRPQFAVDVALSLFNRVELGADQLFRLVGVGLNNFQSSEEPPLFSGGDETSGGEALAYLPVP